jgi:hypothetical protein
MWSDWRFDLAWVAVASAWTINVFEGDLRSVAGFALVGLMWLVLAIQKKLR